ncbi:MAG TPA: hypothetical protein EYP85_01070 [Armatimonadetes bacterium]|nr:hypothetical protein [Armatimonadota bacterium]
MKPRHDLKRDLPNRWGEGQLFAFSGLDGPTDWSHPTTGTLLPDRFGVQFHTPQPRTLWVAVAVNGQVSEHLPGCGREREFASWEPQVVTSDCLQAFLYPREAPEGLRLHALYLFADCYTIRGVLDVLNPNGAEAEVVLYLILQVEEAMEVAEGQQITADTFSCLLTDGADEWAVVDGAAEVVGLLTGARPFASEGANVKFCDPSANSAPSGVRGKAGNGYHRPRRQYLVYRRPLTAGRLHLGAFVLTLTPEGPEEAVWRARRALHTPNLVHLRRRQLAFYQALPEPLTEVPSQRRTYYKSFSILRGNVETAQGQIKFTWATPDRLPHRHLWLWDSAFQALAYREISPTFAEETLKALLSGQRPDGFLAHCFRPDGTSDITQPPTLAWAVWEVYTRQPNHAFLEYCYPRLRDYLEWDFLHRDRNGNGLLEWTRGDESGMDNSPRFDGGCEFDAVDFNCFALREMEHLKRIAEALGLAEDTAAWRKRAQALRERIREFFWDQRDGFFYDRRFDGELVRVKAESGFLPLWAGAADVSQAETLVQHLRAEEEFWTVFPVPSVACNEPTYERNMWRGAVWINYNYLLAQGLDRYGFTALARELRQRTVEEIARWYERTGTVWEFYDPEGEASPADLPRKGTCGAIRDYGWSAALFVQMLLEMAKGEKP